MTAPVATANSGTEPALPGWLRALVDRAEDAALVFDSDLAVICNNERAQEICQALDDTRDPPLKQRARQSLAELRPLVERIRAASGDRVDWYDATIVPLELDASPVALVVARDCTLEYNFSTALVASRELYKDLVACSADFTWETLADGCFSFVSKEGAFGYRGHEFEGRPAREWLHEDSGAAPDSPFQSQTEINEMEVVLKHKDGGRVVVLTSAKPVFADDGTWLATRGVCRDITEIWLRSEAVRLARGSELSIKRIVDLIHDNLSAGDMLSTAVHEVADALAVDLCWICRGKPDTRIEVLASTGDNPGDRQAASESLAQVFENSVDEPCVELAHGAERIIAARCGHYEATLDYLVVAKPAGEAVWTGEERILLQGVAEHVGIVIAQAVAQERLVALSQTDELTGLLNRRAFDAEVTLRIRHLLRTRRSGALLFLDLDNFKAVNDIRGHAAGDAALMAMAEVLRRNTRAGDLIGRIGGDEFALWLEESNRAGAEGKAGRLLSAFGVLKEFSGSEDRPLSVSIGIAMATPEQRLELAELYAVADAALYRVKQTGKGALAVGDVEILTKDGEAPSC